MRKIETLFCSAVYHSGVVDKINELVNAINYLNPIEGGQVGDGKYEGPDCDCPLCDGTGKELGLANGADNNGNPVKYGLSGGLAEPSKADGLERQIKIVLACKSIFAKKITSDGWEHWNDDIQNDLCKSLASAIRKYWLEEIESWLRRNKDTL